MGTQSHSHPPTSTHHKCILHSIWKLTDHQSLIKINKFHLINVGYLFFYLFAVAELAGHRSGLDAEWPPVNAIEIYAASFIVSHRITFWVSIEHVNIDNLCLNSNVTVVVQRQFLFRNAVTATHEHTNNAFSIEMVDDWGWCCRALRSPEGRQRRKWPFELLVIGLTNAPKNRSPGWKV